MTNYITKTIKNGVEANIPVTSVNGQYGDVTVDSGITKVFTLSSTSDLTNAQAAYDWYKNGGNPIIAMTGSSRKWRVAYVVAENGSTNTMCRFESGYATGTTSSWGQMIMSGLNLTISPSGSVISITSDSNQFVTSSTAPASGTGNNKITLVI